MKRKTRAEVMKEEHKFMKGMSKLFKSKYKKDKGVYY